MKEIKEQFKKLLIIIYENNILTIIKVENKQLKL